jgi:hypothetical protein
MAAPDTLLIQYENFEHGRFTHVGRFGPGNQFMAYLTYADPKYYHTEEVTPDGQIIWKRHTNCFAVLHLFGPSGDHLKSEVERVSGERGSEEQDWAKLEEMITRLGEVKLGDIRVKRFRVEVEKIVHGLIYECELHEEDGREIEWVMLQPNDIMFHPPWDSGEYST